MPVIVSRHEFPAEGAEERNELLRQAAGAVIDELEGSASNLEQAFLLTFTEATSRCLLDPLAEYAPTWRAWVSAMQVGSALFASATASEERIDARIAGKVRSIPVSGPNSAANPGNWVKAFWLAIVCREQDRMTQLCNVPISLLRASGTEYDEYVYAWIDALQSYWLQRGNVSEKLVAAVNGTKPDATVIASRALMLKILYPSLELFYRYLRQDREQFNTVLAEALQWHKEYWTEDEDRASSSEGLVALGPLAMAALAHDAGFPFQVQSEYLPRALVEGAWIGEFDT
ncbi:immunity 49 family protein [Streptomyces echinoruber]|uniref:Immunity 49 family protein n=1 Tax=Streptomyces echinoruber TaxID=68898 RepID=A0A918VM39_9ACTN|nr:immunity 49 family protein [Streptomyces echinoruber]GHA09515.1 hypothetical protein GCM10010389_55870 [Streptomyces echinoruber]